VNWIELRISVTKQSDMSSYGLFIEIQNTKRFKHDRLGERS